MPSHEALALHSPDGAVGAPANSYGRLVANAGTFRALVRFGPWARIHVQSRAPRPASEWARELHTSGDDPLITSGTLLATSAPAEAGTLLSGHGYMGPLAWLRRNDGRDADYSIVATIFAFASATHREQMIEGLLAPVHPWDALLCSSPSLKDTVVSTIDSWEEHLRERLGVGIVLPRPQLPVIPIGTDVARIEQQRADGDQRTLLRTSLGVGPGDVVVFFLGRLSYFDKAFPQAMFKAVEAAASRTTARVHFVVAGWFPDGEDGRALFIEAQREYCPSVPVSLLDGNDPAVVAQCWAAADIFLSLSDTILETFGQAVVEAMAAGLPVVVSDWDGYRFIVRHGVDGYRVPTLAPAAGALGRSLALMQSIELLGYPQYMGAVAQHVAVSIVEAASALTSLIDSGELRSRMGEAGRQAARERFDWPVVVAQHVDLFDALAERRRASDPVAGATRSNPLRSDPFVTFGSLATDSLTDSTIVQRGGWTRPGSGVRLDSLFASIRASEAEEARVLDLLDERGPCTVGQLVREFAPQRRPLVRMSLAWLAKAGVITWAGAVR